MQDLERLIVMANQIADNFSFHDDAVERTADHLRRFWAPSMRERIAEHARGGGDGLNATARAAVASLSVA